MYQLVKHIALSKLEWISSLFT